MVVQHNMQAANANRMLGITTSAQSKSTEKLSSGYKINRAADDAAGLAISEKMRSQIRGLDRASTNAQDGVSVVQTAEGALNEVHSMLQRMNELATQAANDTNTSQDRTQIQSEINQLTSEIDRVQSTTQFNTMNLLDGSFSKKKLQVGSKEGQTITLSIDNMSSASLGIKDPFNKVKVYSTADLSELDSDANAVYAFKGKDSKIYALDGSPKTAADIKAGVEASDSVTFTQDSTTGLYYQNTVAADGKVTAGTDAEWAKSSDGKYYKVNKTALTATTNTVMKLDNEGGSVSVKDNESAGKAMTSIQSAIDKVSTQRANLGAVQNRLEHTIANLDNVSENTQSAESRIRDTDMAKEMVTYSKNNILMQAGQSMLAQANQSNQGVLSLLQ